MIYLIVGGCASNKSEFAENLVTALQGNRIYLATMHTDDSIETANKIKRHRMLRQSKEFVTIEKETDICEVCDLIHKDDNVLIECASNLVANEMYIGNIKKPANKIKNAVEELSKKCRNVVVVSLLVGSEGKIYDEFTKEFIDNMALVNKEIGEIADEVYEVVYGIPLKLK